MKTINLHRKSNLMLMGRKFKIYIDQKECDSINDGEIKQIEIPQDAKELTVKIMNYKSKPISLNVNDSESYVIKQNLVSTITTYLMILFAAIFFVSKFVIEKEQVLFLYICTPFVLISIYYSTFGNRSVIQLEKVKDSSKTNGTA